MPAAFVSPHRREAQETVCQVKPDEIAAGNDVIQNPYRRRQKDAAVSL
jgi:hypothetical protein